MQLSYLSHLSCVAGQVERLRVAQLHRRTTGRGARLRRRFGRAVGDLDVPEGWAVVFRPRR